MDETRNKCIELNVCVIIPTYNNVKTLEAVINDVLNYTDRLIVVNDGSTDSTAEILSRFNSITVIALDQNKGKGVALQTGFEAARKQGYRYAITLDSDGQHFPDDLSKFLDKIEETPDSLIIGARNMDQGSVPGGSRFGHKFSNFWYWVETRIRMPDTQSGYRLYPLQKLSSMRFFSTRFEFEIEVIVKAAWNGIPVTSVPVKVYYAPANERVSHFRKRADFARISVLNTWLVILAIAYYHPKRFFQNLNWRTVKEVFKKSFHDPLESPAKKSFAVALGVMMGIMPIWGFQMITAAALALVFRLNKMIVVLATNISIPPVIPFILYGSLKTGEWILDRDVDILFVSGISWNVIKKDLVVYITGSVILAIVAAFIAGLITYVILRMNEKKAVKA